MEQHQPIEPIDAQDDDARTIPMDCEEYARLLKPSLRKKQKFAR